MPDTRSGKIPVGDDDSRSSINTCPGYIAEKLSCLPGTPGTSSGILLVSRLYPLGVPIICANSHLLVVRV